MKILCEENNEEIYPAYDVKYKLSFEPYYIGSVSTVPQHDQTFRGYGYNKVIFI
jgi:hypothetical protein